MARGNFVHSEGCMDGRGWPAIQEYAKNFFSADHVDVTAAEPGYVKRGGRKPSQAVTNRRAISSHHHKASALIIWGHEQCAGNPVDNDLHQEQTVAAARRARKDVPEGVPVHAVFVEEYRETDGPQAGRFTWFARRIPERQKGSSRKKGRKRTS